MRRVQHLRQMSGRLFCIRNAAIVRLNNAIQRLKVEVSPLSERPYRQNEFPTGRVGAGPCHGEAMSWLRRAGSPQVLGLLGGLSTFLFQVQSFNNEESPPLHLLLLHLLPSTFHPPPPTFCVWCVLYLKNLKSLHFIPNISESVFPKKRWIFLWFYHIGPMWRLERLSR